MEVRRRSKSVSEINSLKAMPADTWFTYSDVSHLGWLKPTFSARMAYFCRLGILKRESRSKCTAWFYINKSDKDLHVRVLNGEAEECLYTTLLNKFLRA